MGPRPVPPPRGGPIAGGEPPRQGVLVDPTELVQHLEDGEGHARVVGVGPRASGSGVRVLEESVPVFGAEAGFPEGVADGQAVQRQPRPVEAGGMVGW